MQSTNQIMPGTGIAGMTFARPMTKAEERARSIRTAKKKAARASALAAMAPVPGPAGRMGVDGPRGPRGKAGANGEKGPKGDPGKQGERGPKGVDGKDGKDGSTWLQGDRAPTSKDGSDGDQWFNTASRDVSLKTKGKWKVTTTLRGPRGPSGPTGPRGSSGRDGNRFDLGFGAPPAAKGQSGDIWFDLETGDLYKKQRAGWGLFFNLGARAYAGNGAPTENPHDADDILEGDEPSSESENESEPSSSDFDSESESESEFVSEFG
ncbi:hypothetical protein [Tardiphaga sp. 813_E8_N1_3]|uniref:hypothetical protein n=1 Tax=Tardiphaga sp. 813_E8_N1_3 TaxID=3240760 RepID=UPI003F296D93